MFETKFAEKIKNTHFVFSNHFFVLKSCRFWNNVEKYCRAGQATNDDMAHAHCMLYTQGYKHTLTICNTFCFSPATMVARTHLNIMLYVHCLFFCLCWEMKNDFSEFQPVVWCEHLNNNNNNNNNNNKCRLCQKFDETIDHIISACPIWQKNST